MARQLTDFALKSWKLTDTTLAAVGPHKGQMIPLRRRTDRDGLYCLMTERGTISFRYDYRINGRRETLVIGRYDAEAGRVTRELADLDYGTGMTLAEARVLLAKARRCVEMGESPSRAKAERRARETEAKTFGDWAGRYFAETDLAESTRDMRQAIYNRDVEGAFGRLQLAEITPQALMTLCEKIRDPKGRNAPATAIHVREVVLQVYRFVQARGIKVTNPADAIRPSAIATFKARDRALSPEEIRVFFKALDTAPTLPTLRLALKFVLLTLVRKGEFIDAKWPEVNFGESTWTIPAERMKARRPHVVYLSRQAVDILTHFKTCFAASDYLHAGRYDSDLPISDATLNRVIDVTLERIRDEGGEFESFTVHDLRRTGSTLLHEAGYPSDWIEKCLAHEQRGVRAVYNKAEYSEQRKTMLQDWANMVDAWIAGDNVVPLRKAA